MKRKKRLTRKTRSKKTTSDGVSKYAQKKLIRAALCEHYGLPRGTPMPVIRASTNYLGE